MKQKTSMKVFLLLLKGIGAEIQELDGFIMIVSPIKESPAEKAGLKAK